MRGSRVRDTTAEPRLQFVVDACAISNRSQQKCLNSSFALEVEAPIQFKAADR